MDVTKVDQDVAYVAIVVYICCKGLLPMFHLFFPDACCNCVYYLDVAYVSHIRCMCFIWMLHMIAMVFKCFQVFFCVFSVSSAFRSTLQWLYLDVSKTNWVLHLSSPFAALSCYRRRHPLPLFSLRQRGATWSTWNKVQRAGACSDIRYFFATNFFKNICILKPFWYFVVLFNYSCTHITCIFWNKILIWRTD
jgi:hypothetical protein